MGKERLHIVIADDDLDDHLFIKGCLHDTGMIHECTSVYNGYQLLDLLLHREAYKNMKDLKPDLILLDINMPILNGFGVLKELREIPSFADLPIYMFTSSSSKLDKELAMMLGAKGFYTKPILSKDLIQLLKSITDQQLNSGT